jgi:serine/threonine protein kinase
MDEVDRSEFEEWLVHYVERFGYYDFQFREKGGSGVVYGFRDGDTNMRIVVKVVPLRRPGDGEGDYDKRRSEIMHEASLLRKYGFQRIQLEHGYDRDTRLVGLSPSRSPTDDLYESESEGSEESEESDHGDETLENEGVLIKTVRCALTGNGGFCCCGHVDDGNGVCRRCKMADSDHFYGKAPIAIMVMEYRGLELFDYAIIRLARVRHAPRRFDIISGIITSLIYRLFELWEDGYVHRDLKLENIAIDDNVTYDAILCGKGGFVVSLIDFGSVRSHDFASRMEEPPISSLSGTPHAFNIPWEQHLIRRPGGFVDSPRHDMIRVDMECLAILIEKLLQLCKLEVPDWRLWDPEGGIEGSWMGIYDDAKIAHIISVLRSDCSSPRKIVLLKNILEGAFGIDIPDTATSGVIHA